MSFTHQKLCIKILNEYLGSIVSKIGEVLLKSPSTSFQIIKKESNLPHLKVQEALTVLIKHNLVEWYDIRPGVPGYSIIIPRILLFLRYSRFLILIRELHGDVAEILIDIILKEGKVTASEAIIAYCLKHYEASENDVPGKDQHLEARNIFMKLVENHYIERCAYPDGSELSPKFTILDEEVFKFHCNFLNLQLIVSDIEKKKKAIENDDSGKGSKHPDCNIFWRLNIDRFHLEMRDIEIRKCISRRINPAASECIRALLKVSYTKSNPWSSSLNAVSAYEVKGQQNDIPFLEQHLQMIADNGGGILRKVGYEGGGEYVTNIDTIIETIAISYVENIVQERLGSKAARIFRLVKAKGMMEQSHINRLAMLESKEGNALMFRLLKDNFLQLYELRKSIAATQAIKSLYLYRVEINSVILMASERTHKAVYNVIVQREKRFNEHKRLLERKSRVESIVANLQASGASKEQIQEVEEMFTEGERELGKCVIDALDRLHQAESCLDECLFIFQMYSLFKKAPNK